MTTELPDGRGQRGIVLGLKANWRQFALLVLINAFVGGMVGIERVLDHVVKAFANLVSGQLADTWGRKRVLILGWLFGLPVPLPNKPLLVAQ